MPLCEELYITCNEVVDDGIRTLVCVQSSGYVPHHCTWRGVLRHCQHLVRQAATLRCTQRPKRDLTDIQFNSRYSIQFTTLGHIHKASYSPVA